MKHCRENLFFLLLVLFVPCISVAQNFSNRGKTFWAGHMAHIGGTSSSFALYITTDAPTAAAVRVSIPGGTYNQIVIVPSNQVTVVNIPSNQTYVSCTDCIQSKAVKIESLNHDIVVYEHIYNQNRSDATLLIPVETLGKEYFAMAYTQTPVGSTSRSQMMLIGVEDSTYVDIYPVTALQPARTANVKYTILLNEGELYQVQASNDLSGTRVIARSADGSTCKKIAAFSGSSFVRMGCPLAASGDNLLQQLFPTSAWGNEFVTAPLKTRTGGDLFRVLAMDNGTQVSINGGSPINLGTGQYHDFQTNVANYVVSSKPVMLAQYPRTQNCDNVSGDPTLIVIPPLEQMVNRVTMYSSPYQNITGQYVNVITKSTDTARFRFDNVKQAFVPMAGNPAYAFSQITTTPGNHRLRSDSGFIAISYGFGNVESYGYVGGTNIRNLVQSIEASADSICLGDTLFFKGILSYTPLSLKWYFDDGTTSQQQNPFKVFRQAGNYVVSLVTTRSGITDCSSTDSSVYVIRVHDYPTARFSLAQHCLSDSFYFVDSSSSNSLFSYLSDWSWDFGDTTSGNGPYPVKKFKYPGIYQGTLTVRNNFFCADTLRFTYPVHPNPEIGLVTGDTCPGLPFHFSDTGRIYSGTVSSWDWLVDSVLSLSGASVSFTLSRPGDHYLDLHVMSDSGCSAEIRDTFSVYTPPFANFGVGPVCLGFQSVVEDSSLNYQQRNWSFGSATFQGNPPPFTFGSPGLHPVTLRASSPEGCLDSMTRMAVVYPLPPAGWKFSGQCAGELYRFEPDFDTTGYGALLYTWNIGGVYKSSSPALNIKFDAPGQQQVSLLVQDSNACRAFSDTLIDVNTLPAPRAFYRPACEGSPGRLSDLSTGSVFREWHLNNLVYHDTGVNVVPAIQGERVRLISISDSGCRDSTTLLLSYFEKPKAEIGVNGHCPGMPVRLADQSLFPADDPVASYRWLEDGVVIGTTSTVSRIYSDSVRIRYRLEVSSTKGCRDTVETDHLILDRPEVTVVKQNACAGEEVGADLTVSLQYHRSVQETWTFNGQAFVGPFIRDRIQTPGWYPFVISVTTDSGCVFQAALTDSLQVYPLPEADFTFTPELTTLKAPEIQFRSNSGSGLLWWNFGDGSASLEQDPVHMYADTGIFDVWLTVSNGYGCLDSTLRQVLIQPELRCYVPNAFTPNGDSRNPGFLPVCEGTSGIHLRIWDRWGELVYETTDFTPWDGTDRNGHILPEGLYIYEATLRDFARGAERFRGHVLLLR